VGGVTAGPQISVSKSPTVGQLEKRETADNPTREEKINYRLKESKRGNLPEKEKSEGKKDPSVKFCNLRTVD